MDPVTHIALLYMPILCNTVTELHPIPVPCPASASLAVVVPGAVPCLTTFKKKSSAYTAQDYCSSKPVLSPQTSNFSFNILVNTFLVLVNDTGKKPNIQTALPKFLVIKRGLYLPAMMYATESKSTLEENNNNKKTLQTISRP